MTSCITCTRSQSYEAAAPVLQLMFSCTRRQSYDGSAPVVWHRLLFLDLCRLGMQAPAIDVFLYAQTEL